MAGLNLGLPGAFGAAGAAEGLDLVLARRMAERQQAEAERRARAQEAFQQQQLAESMVLRRQMADDQAFNRQMNQSHQIVSELSPNQSISPETGRILSATGRGDLVKTNPPPAGEGFVLPGSQEFQPGAQPGMIFAGTAGQLDKLADNARAGAMGEMNDRYRSAALDQKQQQINQAEQLLGVRGELLRAQTEAAAAKAEADRNKAAQGPKLPQREDDTVVSIHQMSPLIDELLKKTQARIAAKPKPAGGVMGTLGALPEKAGRLITKGAYSAGLPIAPADSERIQLASLLEILGTVPYLRGIRNMQFVKQIQQHLSDPTATDESLAERLQTLKRILPGMEQAIYDVHNQGKIPHSHENMGAKENDPLGLRK